MGRIRSSIEWRLINGWPGRLAREAALRHPVVFGGPRERLRTGSGVVLNDALLNVSSGTITIGDDTFFGHGVTVLTGAHDVAQREAARRESVPTSGRDVVIGRGVWIASNATIVGPCAIGDHAVIAAGAVVCDDVPESTMVAGVPARTVRSVA
jgi:acetyltransferase-like isoleucine patch superfamily enzyme